jgi:hypothetical protein
MARWLSLGAMIAAAALACGCAQVSVSTNVRPDGSWRRTLQFRADRLDRLKESFVLPHGSPWRARKEWVNREAVYTASRALPRGGEAQHDFVMKAPGKSGQKPLVVNEVSVRAVAPGRLEYREVLRWQAPRPPGLLNPERPLLRRLQSALPPGLATEAVTRDLARSVLREVWRLWFGSDSLLDLTGHSDLAERRLKQRIGILVDRALQRQFGDRLTRTQRRAAALRWAGIVVELGRDSGDGSHAGPLGLSEKTLTPLLFTVRLPGRVVATNGEYDELAGEVYWGLYPEAAAAEDVSLIATCDLRAPLADTTSPTRQTYANKSPNRVNSVPRPSPSATSAISVSAESSGD